MSQKLTAPSWIYKRVAAMNRILKKYNNKPMHEHFVDEHWRLMEIRSSSKRNTHTS